MFNKIIYKTSNGIYLNAMDERYLLNCLGLKHSFRFYLYIFLNVMIDLSLIIVAFGAFNDPHLFLLWIVFLGIPVWTFYLYHYYTKNQKQYYRALNDYIKSEFDDFENYSNYYTYVYDKENLLDKNIITDSVFFITNGYEFYIYNDFLEATNYYLNSYFKSKHNDNPRLKVIARRKEKALAFYLKDIDEYFVYEKKGNIEKYNFDPLTKVFSAIETKKYTSLKLKNGMEYKFGPEIFLCLKKYCPIGEIKNE